MFPVKHTVIYTFFAITSVQNTCFCSVFNALASKNPAKSCYVQCFFHFWPFFHCRKATKMTQNSISIPSCAQTPKNPRKMSKTPPYSGLGAKPFLAPPPPAKADIATAILTNVIEHLVLLLPPNKHAFTAKAVWADLMRNIYAICTYTLYVYIHIQTYGKLVERPEHPGPSPTHPEASSCFSLTERSAPSSQSERVLKTGR